MGNGTGIGRVRGLGSAKAGSDSWWKQKLTAGANLALMLWFLISLARLPGYDYSTITLWLSSAWAAVPLILLVLSVFHHLHHGLLAVIEDYHHGVSRIVLRVLLDYAVIALAVLAVFSILHIAFTPVSGALA